MVFELGSVQIQSQAEATVFGELPHLYPLAAQTHTYSPMEVVQSYPEERSLFGVLTQVSTKSIPLCVSLAIVLFMLLGVKTYMRLPKKLRDTATYNKMCGYDFLGRPSMYEQILRVLAFLWGFLWVVFYNQSQMNIHKGTNVSEKLLATY